MIMIRLRLVDLLVDCNDCAKLLVLLYVLV